MSITFTAEIPITSEAALLVCASDHVFCFCETLDQAWEFMNANPEKFCAECDRMEQIFFGEMEWEHYSTNMSHVNGKAVLERLNIFSTSGEMDATDFLLRVEIMDTSDSNQPDFIDGNIIHFGQRDNYFVDAQKRLRSTAIQAIEAGVDIRWG